MKKIITTCCFCFALAMIFVAPATASVVIYGGSLAEGVYFGTGNSNVGWSYLTAGSLELGLRPVNRYLGAASEVGQNYFVPTGATAVPGKTGSEWGIDFSVDTDIDSLGTTLVGYNYNLTIFDTTNGHSVSFDPSSIPDNAHLGAVGFQNSEAMSFSFISVPLGYNMNASDIYRITLSATQVVGGDVQSLSVFVNAQAPEPAGQALVGLFALCAIFAFKKMRRVNTSTSTSVA